MAALPAAYRWLANEPACPRMIVEAIKEYGVVEKPGAGDNPVILGWARETGLAADFPHDQVPWCGLFIAAVAKRAGKAYPDKPLWALNWAKFGRALRAGEQSGLGDVLTFRRPLAKGGFAGHVALYVGEDDTAFHVIGGNQNDQVSFTRMAKARLNSARRPNYGVQPAGVRQIRLSPLGGLSSNEA